MAILLICWACASIAFCLALFGVAARQPPRMTEQMTAGCEPALRQETGDVSEKVETDRVSLSV